MDKNDRIKMKPVVIETIPKTDKIRPSNAFTPIETPLHLQKAANNELSRILAAGQIEKCETATDWCARGFFGDKAKFVPN